MNRRAVIVSSLVALIAVAPCAGIYASIRARDAKFAKQAHVAYAAQIRALRAENIPLQMAQLQDPAPPPMLDAGPIYHQIDQEKKSNPLTGPDKILTDGFPTRQMPTPQQISDAHTAVQHGAHLLALIHTAASRPQCDLRINWGAPDPAAILFPQFAGMRMSARSLSVESFDLAQQGQMQKAVQTQALGFQIANHCYTGKTIIATLVAIAIDSITLEGMRKILYLSHGDPAIAQLVLDAVRDNYHTPHISDALKGELTFQVSEIEYVRTIGPKSMADLSGQDANTPAEKSPWDHMNQDQWSAYIDDNAAFSIAGMRRAISVVDMPYPKSNSQMEAIDADLEKAMSKPDKRYALAAILSPVPMKLASKRSVIDVDAAIVETSARLLIQNAKAHEFPANLSELLGAPLDPFTGQLMHYRREGDGFVIYSVGEDGNFDGGTPAQKPGKYQSVFHYPQPAYYAVPDKTP